ncbi:MAG: pitrilysin family protein, partial [Candidatus Woesebacteria bacterium]|nr:pitrilysin family protein [Candidatus Woesebacteria bacterium]
EISAAVDAIGGEFNAATSKDWTNFYIKADKNNLETAFDVLSDMVLNPLMKPEEIEREKGTIVQEIRMYEDTPMMHIGEVFEGLIFDGNPLGRDTAGTEASVKAINRDDFVRYRKMHYYPENMLVTIAGGVDENKGRTLVEKYFSTLKGQSQACFKGQAFKAIQKKPQFKLQTKKCEQAHLILGFASEGRGYPKRFAQSLLSVILGGGMSSRLFIEVRERRGLAYSVRTSLDRYQDTGYIGTYAGVNVAKADEAIKVILDQCYGIPDSRFKIQDSELQKAKGYLKGNLALALEDTHDVSGFFGEQHLFLKKVLTPEEIYKKVDAVNLEDVNFEAKKLFVPSRLNLAMIGPFKDEKKFVQLLK